jgi:hypothetical protein
MWCVECLDSLSGEVSYIWCMSGWEAQIRACKVQDDNILVVVSITKVSDRGFNKVAY